MYGITSYPNDSRMYKNKSYIFTGNQSGSPMPPRPPSNQVDGPGQVASNMSNQGMYNLILKNMLGCF